MLSRTIYGAHGVMAVGLIPIAIILMLGTVIGMMAGFGGKHAANMLMRLTDIIYAFRTCSSSSS